MSAVLDNTLYLQHFGLSEPPFSLTPDTGFFYAATPHQEALNVLLVALHNGEGFIKVTGEVGLGKTLLCRMLLNSLAAEPGWVTAYIPNPHLSPGSIRVSLAEELGVEAGSRPTQEKLSREITRRLLELAQASQRCVLVLDEAQALPEQTLETVRLLTNLETEKNKLLQVVLFGQPELNARLAQPSLRQLKQRITFSYGLTPLDGDATDHYIRHRLRIAGQRGTALFSADALAALHPAARGVPRLINILCHKALLAAYGPGASQVGAQHMRRAIADTEGAWRPGFWRRWWWGLTGGLATASVLLGLVWHGLPG